LGFWGHPTKFFQETFSGAFCLPAAANFNVLKRCETLGNDVYALSLRLIGFVELLLCVITDGMRRNPVDFCPLCSGTRVP
jgi:hypothetical protein